MNKFLRKIKDNKGVTGADICAAVVIFVMFTGIIATVLYNSYSTSIAIVNSANASAYATIILETVDQKPFNEIDSNFITTMQSNDVNLKNTYLLTSPVDKTKYGIGFKVENVSENLKSINLRIVYYTSGEEQELIINKLKVREQGV